VLQRILGATYQRLIVRASRRQFKAR
jgi:hypothetical protein